MKQAKAGKPPLYYGWYIVFTCMFIALLTNGVRNSFTVFIIPLETDFGWSRGTISTAAAVGFFVNALTQPFLGRIFDLLGGRRVLLFSMIAFGLATVLLSLTFHFLFLVFLFGVVSGIATSGTSLSNTMALVSRWFRRRRGTVTGINAAGLAAGGFLIVPFAAYMLQATNWRVTWAILGMLVLGLGVPLAYLFLRDDPSQMGLQPDGDPNPPDDEPDQTPDRVRGPLEVDRWAQAFRSLPIWQLSGSYFVCGFTTSIISIHFVPFAIDQGISPILAATIFSFMMALNMVGSLSAGFVSDRFGGSKNWLALVYLCRGAAYVLLLLVPGAMGLWVFAAVAGLSWVATNPLTTTLTADVYGLRALGTIGGISFFFHAMGAVISVPMAGFIYDATGSYTIPFAIAGALLFPAAISAFTIQERKYSMRYAPAAAVAGTSGASGD
ncbi:MAG: MFS transporter [Chloroflexi bacterium]|nr:MFS transporter [Chloroflexota bacterium]